MTRGLVAVRARAVLVASAWITAAAVSGSAQAPRIPAPGSQVMDISRAMAGKLTNDTFLETAAGSYTLSFVARDIWSASARLERGDPANSLILRADGTFILDHTVSVEFRIGNGQDVFPPGRRAGPARVSSGSTQRLELAHQADPLDDPLSIGHAGYASKVYDGAPGGQSIFEADVAAAVALGALNHAGDTEFLILQFYVAPKDEIWFFVKTGA